MTNSNANHGTPLYQRLGGSDGIRRLVDDIVDAHVANPAIRARFLPYLDDPEKVSQVKNHLCGFIEAGSGGDATYPGRTMPDAHRGMNIAPHEYMAAVDDIIGALRKHGADEATQKDMLFIAWSLKDDIMHV